MPTDRDLDIKQPPQSPRALGARAAAGLRLATLLIALPVLLGLTLEAGLRVGGALWAWFQRWGQPASSFPVYVVGESTAYGEPFAPKISFPMIVSLMLGGTVRGKPIRIINLSKPGSNTGEQYGRLFRELFLRPPREGVVLIYVGINEDWPEVQSRCWDRLASRSIVLSRLAALLEAPGRPVISLDYEQRLARLIALARSHGLPVVVSTLVGNVREFAPAVSWRLLLDRELARSLELARREERAGRWRAAARIYEGMRRGEDTDPGVLHRLAYCQFKLGRYGLAGKLYREAIDRGGTKRPLTGQNEAIRRLAAQRGVALSDAQALFSSAAPHGLPGYELFMDAHHPNLRGYLLLARGFADQAARLLGAAVVRPDLSQAQLEAESAFSQADQQAVYASRFIWFCGEAYERAGRDETLAMAARYLDLVERGAGHKSPAYRFLLALLERDAPMVVQQLADSGALYRDQDALAAVGRNVEWVTTLVHEAGLSGPLAAAAQRLVTYAGDLARIRHPSGAETGGGGFLAWLRPSRRGLDHWELRRFAASKLHADRGVELALSGHATQGRRELDEALEIYPDNAEAALSLCSMSLQEGLLESAVRSCDQALLGAEQAGKPYPADFIAQCRTARAEARARLERSRRGR